MKKVVTILAIAGIVGIAGAVPAGAQAYGGEPGLSCANDVITGDHFTPGTTPTVYLNGDAVGQADVGGDGSFSFQLPSSVGAGEFTVTIEGTSVRTTCTVEIAGITVVKTPPAGTAFTGSSVVTPALIAVGLFLLGMASLIAGRRRRRERTVAASGRGDDATH